MKRLVTTGMVVLAATALAASGAKYKSPKDACIQAVADVQAAFDGKDIGEKASIEVEKLIEISAHLCDQGNFAYAQDLLRLARTMLASE